MNTGTLPDGPSGPRFVPGGMALVAPLWMMRRLRERCGSAFMVNIPVFGEAVVISDPAEVTQLLTTSPEIADNLDVNLGMILSPKYFRDKRCARSRSASGGGSMTMVRSIHGQES